MIKNEDTANCPHCKQPNHVTLEYDGIPVIGCQHCRACDKEFWFAPYEVQTLELGYTWKTHEESIG